MDTIACIQAPPIRKGKKKQARDEVDHLKQAKKKKRCLEKALATSAAIRSELEKKKQKKKKEQQWLDEEGAAIAEAVAMHVLLGEDLDESCKILLQQDEGFNPWNHASNIGLFMGGQKAGPGNQGYTRYSLEGLGRKWNDWGIGRWSLSQDIFGKERHAPYFEERICGTTEILTGLIAAQAVSSLQIEEDAHPESILINRMLRR
ncbi:hypothetical protein IFM89_019518 [Coptis chinensis]|uniref:Uncharacterized protein n=1 Tax=Coptis chinensis TaxID=261450 RepID=A0A835I4G3_9MAGN|nr:hypothetical protein IFM89_019518 [Coptis chinensis]